MDELDRVIAEVRSPPHPPRRRWIDWVADGWEWFEAVTYLFARRIVEMARMIAAILVGLAILVFWLAVLIACAYGAWHVVSGLADRLAPKRYAAEVGYHHGEDIAWDLWGDFDDLDTCRSAAIARYNFYAVEQQGRGFSWSCLLKNGKGGYASRHR
jgi:hypothetical protein